MGKRNAHARACNHKLISRLTYKHENPRNPPPKSHKEAHKTLVSKGKRENRKIVKAKGQIGGDQCLLELGHVVKKRSTCK